MEETWDGLESFVVFVERNAYEFQNKDGRGGKGLEKV